MHAASALQSTSPRQGISLVEVLIVIALVSIIGVLGYSNLSATKQKQAIIDTTAQLQVALDSARANSIAQTPNPVGIPVAWGVVIDHLSLPKQTFLAPFGSPQPAFDAIPPPSGSRKYAFGQNIEITTNPTILNNNQLLYINFELLTGKPLIKKLNRNGRLVTGFTYNNNANLEIVVKNKFGQQSVIINPAGITTISKFR